MHTRPYYYTGLTLLVLVLDYNFLMFDSEFTTINGRSCNFLNHVSFLEKKKEISLFTVHMSCLDSQQVLGCHGNTY